MKKKFFLFITFVILIIFFITGCIIEKSQANFKIINNSNYLIENIEISVECPETERVFIGKINPKSQSEFVSYHISNNVPLGIFIASGFEIKYKIEGEEFYWSFENRIIKSNTYITITIQENGTAVVEQL